MRRPVSRMARLAAGTMRAAHMAIATLTSAVLLVLAAGCGARPDAARDPAAGVPQAQSPSAPKVLTVGRMREPAYIEGVHRRGQLRGGGPRLRSQLPDRAELSRRDCRTAGRGAACSRTGHVGGEAGRHHGRHLEAAPEHSMARWDPLHQWRYSVLVPVGTSSIGTSTPRGEGRARQTSWPVE